MPEAMSEQERYESGNLGRDLALAPAVGELALQLAGDSDES